MTLEEQINKLGDRFIGMSRDNTTAENGRPVRFTRIEVDLRSNVPDYKWQIFSSPIEAPIELQVIKVIKRDSNDSVYHIFSTEENVEFSHLIDHAQLIVDTNVDMEKKMVLIKEKMNELSDLFQKLSYKELSTLTFNYKKNKSKDYEKKQSGVLDGKGEQQASIPVERKESKQETLGEGIKKSSPETPTITMKPLSLSPKNKKKIKDNTPEVIIPADFDTLALSAPLEQSAY